MARHFIRLIWNEFLLVRSNLAVLLIAVFQPALLYFLMTLVLVHPTFDLNFVPSDNPDDERLLQAMNEVGVQSGVPYINPIILSTPSFSTGSQYIQIVEDGGVPVAVQHFALVDSNMVKNYRNRLTAAGLIVWNEELGRGGIKITEKPLLPVDVPYRVYFGLAVAPMAAFLATMLIGATSTTHDFENDTFLEYRLSPLHTGRIMAARIMRTMLFGYFAAGVLFIMIWLLSGYKPHSWIMSAVYLLPICLIGSSLGVSIGLAIRRPLPAFVLSLASTFVFWLLGGAFGLPSGFNSYYQIVSKFIPNTHVVELMFPLFYGIQVGTPIISAGILVVQSMLSLLIVGRLYNIKAVRG
jgi:hypothetical protein